MRIEVYTTVWNEEFFIQHFIRYYATLAERVDFIVFNNGCTDGTLEKASLIANGMENVSIGFNNTISDGLNDKNYLHVKENAWKGSKADYVICCDVDELLYIDRKNLKTWKRQGVTIAKGKGYNIYSDNLPQKSIFEINTGFQDDNFSKTVIFDPKAIKRMNYSWGAHTCNPQGRLHYPNQSPALLHYRCIGGVDARVKRHVQYHRRMSDFNKANGLGIHYNWTKEQIHREWQLNVEKCRPLEFVKP